MSKQAVKWADAQKLPDVTLMAVLRAVAFLADQGGYDCRKSHEDIAARAGLKPRAVRYALRLLQDLEVIKRTVRSKGKYGRTTDLISLSADRSFDLSSAAIKALRKSARTTLQPAPRATPYNTVDKEDSLSVGISSLPIEGTYTHDTCDAGTCETPSSDRDNPPTAQLIRFPARGAL